MISGLWIEFHDPLAHSMPTAIMESTRNQTFLKPESCGICKPWSAALSSALPDIHSPKFSVKPLIHSPLCPRRTPLPAATLGFPSDAPSKFKSAHPSSGASHLIKTSFYQVVEDNASGLFDPRAWKMYPKRRNKNHTLFAETSSVLLKQNAFPTSTTTK